MSVAEGAQQLTHEIGLHARPAVKLTQLAAKYDSAVQLRVGQDGDWIDAKSVVKVMRLKARTGKTLHFRAEGGDADAAVAALRGLVARGFVDAE
jgi:phosphocarrier protein